MFAGRFNKHNANLAEVKGKLSFQKTKFYYSKLGSASAFTTKKLSAGNQTNHYKNLFGKGADLIPRNFYFIEPTQEVGGVLKGKTFTARTSEAVNAQAKAPWKGIKIEGRVSGNYLFRTALAQNVLPFALHEPPMVLLPAKITERGSLKLLSSMDLIKEGALDTAQWFKKVEDKWEQNRTENNANTTNIAYLNFRNKLTSQKCNAPYIVMYTGSAKDANAVVVRRSDFDLDFVVDYTTYFLTCGSFDEANYLCSFLNSHFANDVMKDFQSRGLFGPRHVSKKILDVGLAEFDANNPTHCDIANLAKTCHAKALDYIAQHQLLPNLSTHALDKHRLAIRYALQAELNEIDRLFKSL